MRRAVSCNILGVIFRVHIRFIGVLLLLVDDYHSEVVKRGENGRARADNYVSTAVFYSSVGVEALSLGESRMYYCHSPAVS